MIGQYLIDFPSKSIQVEDQDQNTFKVSLDDVCSSKLFTQVALESKKSDDTGEKGEITDIAMKYFPIPKDPIEPTLLVIFDDGSGFELLSSKSIKEVENSMTRNALLKLLSIKSKPWISGDASLMSHKFELSLLSSEPDRIQFTIPSIMRKSLENQLEINKVATTEPLICRHILQRNVLDRSDIEKASQDWEKYKNLKQKRDEHQQLLSTSKVISPAQIESSIEQQLHAAWLKQQESERKTEALQKSMANSDINLAQTNAEISLLKLPQENHGKALNQLQAAKLDAGKYLSKIYF